MNQRDFRPGRVALPSLPDTRGRSPSAQRGGPQAEAHGRSRPDIQPLLTLFVQRATIDLFAAYDVAVAPTGSSVGRPLPRPDGHLVGAIGMKVGTAPGRLTLALSDATLTRTKPAATRSARQDWLRELTNQLAGRVGNRFARYQVAVTWGLPTASEGFASRNTATGESAAACTLWFSFLVLRDTIHVMFSCPSDVPFAPEPSAAPDEGDVIMF